MRPILLVSDCHISPLHGDGTAEDLARLLAANPEAELVLNGDTWDLSWDVPGRLASETISEWVRQAPRLAQAMAERLARGAPITIVVGNHDAALSDRAVLGALQAALNVPGEAPLRVASWWTRRGMLHIEHGHFFDPDNAPLFPLGAPHRQRDEPLGVALTRRFVAPNRAFTFAHAHETTPLAGLWHSLRHFGPRALRIIHEYYGTALTLTLEATRRQRTYDHEAAAAAWRDLACAQSELAPVEAVGQIVKLLPTPTHARGCATFERLYLDRSLALAAVCFGLVAPVPALPGALAGCCGGAYLALSLLRGRNRYAGNLETRLESAACAIAEITRAKRVVFGHTHEAQSRGPYINLGSFGMARNGARSWAYANEHGHVSLEQFRVA